MSDIRTQLLYRQAVAGDPEAERAYLHTLLAQDRLEEYISYRESRSYAKARAAMKVTR